MNPTLMTRAVEVKRPLARVQTRVRSPQGRPYVIGHRGDPRHHPENSLDGLLSAIAAGADGVEFDVRLAGDGVPVVCHDADLRRTHREHVPLRALPARLLPVPTLESVLATLARTAPRTLLNIELKEAVPPAVLERILQRSGWHGPAVVTSFLPDTATAHAAHGRWPSGLLTDDRRLQARDAVALLDLTGVTFLVVRNPVFLASLREALHERDAALWVWTLNRRAHLQRADRLGADAVITDVPGFAADVLARPPPPAPAIH